jgi:muramidase (phage lysozyme)
MLLTGRVENTVKGAYVITAPTQLVITYTQHPRRCKTNPKTMMTGQRTTAPSKNFEVLIILMIFNRVYLF